MAPNDPPLPLLCSVVIPSYGRPQALQGCLAALSRQSRRPDEVVVVAREGDQATRAVLEAVLDRLPLRVLTIREPGLVAALNLALAEARGDIVSFIDDDTEPWADWLERVERHFASQPRLGGLGGRDWLYADGVLRDGRARTVGRVQWFGRRIGNHHLGVGPPREVEILKGANMSYRRAAVQGLWFDRRLKGGDAEWCVEPGFVFATRRRGWKVVYDPAVAVDHHHPATRLATDQKRLVERTYNRVFNETLVLLEYLPPYRRAIFVPWAFVVGTRDAPGLVQWVRYLLTGSPAATPRLLLAWRARRDALRVFRPGRPAAEGGA